jgi:hypothetical protein
MKNNSADTQEFFSSVVSGTADQYKPIKPWQSLIAFNPEQQGFKRYYDMFKGNFDEHIATSIPSFRENQIVVGAAIVRNLQEGLMYDIGGSEGGFCKAITLCSAGRVNTINLDPNEEMELAHESKPVLGAEYVKEAFYEGFEYDGITYPTHKPSQKADIVHESMTFQFITKDREQFIKEIKENYLKKDGLFITEQKFTSDDPELYAANEVTKNKYKKLYYTPEQLATKDESVLVGMRENQADGIEFSKLLRANFRFVTLHWISGNFAGFMATDSADTYDKYKNVITCLPTNVNF